MLNPSLRCTACSGPNRIATGELRHVALKAKQAFDAHPQRPVLIFDDTSGGQLDLPLELPAADLLRLVAQPVQRPAEPAPPRKPGRPKPVSYTHLDVYKRQPLALLALLLWPFVWLLALPFRLVGITFTALFAFLHALLMLPARLLGGARSLTA